LGNLSSLDFLRLTGNQLSGEIPIVLSNLSNLFHLSLSYNQLTGTIPPELGMLSNLNELELAGNLLTGTIPVELGNLTNLFWLDLGWNQLSGAVPAELGNLINLQFLNLGGNPITDPIPAEFSNMANLWTLYLDYTNLTDLPDLTNLTNLVELAVFLNDFTFEDIEPNVGIQGIMYSPQNNIPAPGPIALEEGDELNISIQVGGSANQYQWVKDEVDIDGATTDNLVIENVSVADIGTYYLNITSALVPDLTLRSDDILVDVLVGIQDETLSNELNIYPIPLRSQLNIKSANLPEGEYTLRIVDLSGKVMINEQLAMNNSNQDHIIDVSVLPTGMYMVMMQHKDGVFVQKVVKE
jgi:hypothetical protein